MAKRTATNHPEIWLYPNGIYYGRPWVGGRYREYSLETRKFNEAKEKYKHLIRRLDPGSMGAGLRVEDVQQKFLEDKKRLLKNGERRERTIEEYEHKFKKHLLPYFQYKKLSEIDTEMWEKYVDEKRGASLKHHRKIFGNFLRWCMRKGFIKGIPELPIPKYKSKRGKALTEEQLVALFENCQSLKLTVFCALYLYCAMRSREITALEWTQFYADRRAIHLPEDKTKNTRERWIPLNEVTFDLLMAYHDELIKSYGKLPKWLMPMRGKPSKPTCTTGIYKSFGTAKRKAGIDFDITPHDFRHTWVTEARNNPHNADANLEKFAGSASLVQKGTYHHPTVESLRPLADTIQVPALTKIIKNKLNSRGNYGGNGNGEIR